MTTSPRTASILAPLAARAVADAARASTTADTRRVARTALGCARLSPALAAEVDRVASLAWERSARGPVASPASTFVIARLHAHALDRVRPLVLAAYRECGYRVAEGRWAGGDHATDVVIGNPRAASDTARAWSRNGKWSGLNSWHTLTVRPTWDRRVPVSARVVSGLLTLDVDPAEVAPGIHRAAWVEQGRGTSLRTVHGYLVRRADGSWAHADTERAARVALRAPAPARTPADVSTLDAPAILRRARCAPEVSITLTSAPVEGRVCAAGVRDWAARHLPDRTTATAREVADAAASSRDRVAEVLIVLRAAGMRARMAAQSVAA